MNRVIFRISVDLLNSKENSKISVTTTPKKKGNNVKLRIKRSKGAYVLEAMMEFCKSLFALNHNVGDENPTIGMNKSTMENKKTITKVAIIIGNTKICKWTSDLSMISQKLQEYHRKRYQNHTKEEKGEHQEEKNEEWRQKLMFNMQRLINPLRRDKYKSLMVDDVMPPQNNIELMKQKLKKWLKGQENKSRQPKENSDKFVIFNFEDLLKTPFTKVEVKKEDNTPDALEPIYLAARKTARNVNEKVASLILDHFGNDYGFHRHRLPHLINEGEPSSLNESISFYNFFVRSTATSKIPIVQSTDYLQLKKDQAFTQYTMKVYHREIAGQLSKYLRRHHQLHTFECFHVKDQKITKKKASTIVVQAFPFEITQHIKDPLSKPIYFAILPPMNLTAYMTVARYPVQMKNDTFITSLASRLGFSNIKTNKSLKISLTERKKFYTETTNKTYVVPLCLMKVKPEPGTTKVQDTPTHYLMRTAAEPHKCYLYVLHPHAKPDTSTTIPKEKLNPSNYNLFSLMYAIDYSSVDFLYHRYYKLIPKKRAVDFYDAYCNQDVTEITSTDVAVYGNDPSHPKASQEPIEQLPSAGELDKNANPNKNPGNLMRSTTMYFNSLLYKTSVLVERYTRVFPLHNIENSVFFSGNPYYKARKQVLSFLDFLYYQPIVTDQRYVYYNQLSKFPHNAYPLVGYAFIRMEESIKKMQRIICKNLNNYFPEKSSQKQYNQRNALNNALWQELRLLLISHHVYDIIYSMDTFWPQYMGSISPNDPFHKIKGQVKVQRNLHGELLKPFPLSGIITVFSLGHVLPETRNYHTDKYIWPIGFKSHRVYASMKEPWKRIRYACEIRENGEAPVWLITPEDDPHNVIEGKSATSVWTIVIKHVNTKKKHQSGSTSTSSKKIHTNVSGPEYYGLAHPTVQRLISELPGASEIPRANATFSNEKLEKNKDNTIINADDSDIIILDKIQAKPLVGPPGFNKWDQEKSLFDHFASKSCPKHAKLYGEYRGGVDELYHQMYDDSDMAKQYANVKDMPTSSNQSVSPKHEVTRSPKASPKRKHTPVLPFEPMPSVTPAVPHEKKKKKHAPPKSRSPPPPPAVPYEPVKSAPKSPRKSSPKPSPKRKDSSKSFSTDRRVGSHKKKKSSKVKKEKVEKVKVKKEEPPVPPSKEQLPPPPSTLQQHQAYTQAQQHQQQHPQQQSQQAHPQTQQAHPQQQQAHLQHSQQQQQHAQYHQQYAHPPQQAYAQYHQQAMYHDPQMHPHPQMQQQPQQMQQHPHPQQMQHMQHYQQQQMMQVPPHMVYHTPQGYVHGHPPQPYYAAAGQHPPPPHYYQQGQEHYYYPPQHYPQYPPQNQ